MRHSSAHAEMYKIKNLNMQWRKFNLENWKSQAKKRSENTIFKLLASKRLELKKLDLRKLDLKDCFK